MLSLLGHLYGTVGDFRNRLYDRGILDTFDLGARTMSVGNITAGGTGKTPLVAHIARILSGRGETVAILSRGYGRADESERVLVSDGVALLAHSDRAGDEPAQLAEQLLGKAIVIADADRVSAAEWAIRRFAVTAFVLDDGFQHRRARRDLDIVCIDATAGLHDQSMLPAGMLREPLHNLSRADVVVITRANLTADLSALRGRLSELAPRAVVFEASNRISGFRSLPLSANSQTPGPRESYAFCGVGNPESFFRQLELEKIVLVGTRIFPDHHPYTHNDLDALVREASGLGAGSLVTTWKDAVKLREMRIEIPIFVVETELELNDPEGFAALL